MKGKTLDVILKENGPVSVYTAIEFVRQLCDAFHHLHSQTPPYIYGNMKPSDVIVKPNGEFILTSHGTARAMDFNLNMMREEFTCVLMPSSGYSAPEMYRGFEQADEKTDIYTLGVLMYYLLTGHDLSVPPYEMYPIRQWNTEFPKELEKIILKCTQKNPVERYQSCAELLSALEGVLTCENRKMNLFDRIFNRA